MLWVKKALQEASAHITALVMLSNATSRHENRGRNKHQGPEMAIDLVWDFNLLTI